MNLIFILEMYIYFSFGMCVLFSPGMYVKTCLLYEIESTKYLEKSIFKFVHKAEL